MDAAVEKCDACIGTVTDHEPRLYLAAIRLVTELYQDDLDDAAVIMLWVSVAGERFYQILGKSRIYLWPILRIDIILNLPLTAAHILALGLEIFL